MSYVKPLTAAMALGLAMSCTASLATPSGANATPPTASTHKATYYIADWGTPQAHRVYYFNRLDRNHNGQLSRAEIPKDMHRLRVHFIQADWNGNGQLSPSEYVMWKEHTAPMYSGPFHKFVVVFPPPPRR